MGFLLHYITLLNYSQERDDIIPVYKAKDKTKDGRAWFFMVRYQDIDGRNAQYKSGKFATKKEAEDAEPEFRLKIHRHENMDKITLDEMIDIFIENRTTTIEVKPTT